MRLSVPVFVLFSVFLAACGKADPTKPIPWIKPKDPKASVENHATSEAARPSIAEHAGVTLPKQRPNGSDVCGIPRGYAEVALSDVLASPGAYAGERIQVAGWLGTRWSFVGLPVEGVPVCQSHASPFLGEVETEGFLDEPEERLDLRGPELVKLGATCFSAEVPDADVVVAWGTVSPAGDEVFIDGVCAADQLPCKTAAHCPGAMECGGAGLCEMP